LMQNLLEKCELIKIALSSSMEESIYLGNLFPDLDVELEVTRSQFEQLCRPKLMEAIVIVKRILSNSRLGIDMIDEVLLVGATSRIPLIEDLLITQVGFESSQINKSVNADEVVARGAAILAAQGTDMFKGGEFGAMELLEVTPLSIGDDTLGGIHSVVMKRHASIPSKASRTFYTVVNNQTSMAFRLYEGERKLVANNSFLGSLDINGLPKDMAGRVGVELTLDIDQNGLLHATAKHSGKTVTMDIDYQPRRSGDPGVSEAIRDAELHNEVDTAEEKRVRARNALGQGIERTRYKCAPWVTEVCDRYQNWLRVQQGASAGCFEMKLEAMKLELGIAYVHG